VTESASYTLLVAVGSISPQVLRVRIEVYNAMVHYQQVRDVWEVFAYLTYDDERLSASLRS
jgi:hypothetical protein